MWKRIPQKTHFCAGSRLVEDASFICPGPIRFACDFCEAIGFTTVSGAKWCAGWRISGTWRGAKNCACFTRQIGLDQARRGRQQREQRLDLVARERERAQFTAEAVAALGAVVAAWLSAKVTPIVTWISPARSGSGCVQA